MVVTGMSIMIVVVCVWSFWYEYTDAPRQARREEKSANKN